MKVTVGVSNRHVHLSREDVDILFGKGYEITKLRDINQKGQFAANETITIKTEKTNIPRVRVLGPVREYTQLEISRTDAFKLGIDPPIRTSGDLNNSESITLIGPRGEVYKNSSCIQANRHIHISAEDKKKFGFENIEEVSLKINTVKGGIMNNVYFKVSDDAYFELHIDTDDANAFMLKNGDEVEIIKKD